MRKFRFPEDTWHSVASVTAGGAAAIISVGLLVGLLMRIPFGLPQVDAALRWFDPWFVQYNLSLIIFAILIVPFLTIHYVASRRYEKLRRLTRELCERRGEGGAPVWGETIEACNTNVRDFVYKQFRLRAYGPSMVAMMVTIAFGVSILLLAKPVFHGTNGIDYAKGANMLLIGPYAKFYITPDADMFRQVLMSLCAFQYGFLGAFIYAISSLVWSYFNVDLTPHSLVAGTVRMVTASVLALVLSFFLPTLPAFAAKESNLVQVMPVLAFFLGYFPNRALLLLERVGRKFLSLGSHYASTPLHALPGLGLSDEWRLTYEGLDNLEHMENADPLDLAIRTGYSYTQLCAWRDQAWLATRMRDDYLTWIAKTSILGREALRDYFRREPDRIDDVIAKMSAASGVPEVKLRALYVLLCLDAPSESARDERSSGPKLSPFATDDHPTPAAVAAD